MDMTVTATATPTNLWTLPLQQLASDWGDMAPKILSALVVLAGGLALAWLIRALTLGAFKVLKLDARLQNLWLFRFWTRGMGGHGPSETLSSFFFYLVLFVTILLSIHLIGVDGGEKILSSLLGVVPRVLSFMLILFLGALLAMFFSVIGQFILAGSRAQHPAFWGKVIAWGTFGMTVMFSLEPLGLVGNFLTVAVYIVFGVIGLAAAIAFGLGCKDLAREFIIELLKDNGAND